MPLKKERLLLESNKNIDNRTLVDLIANGLPTFIRNRINRQDTKSTNDLFNELGKHDDIITKNPTTYFLIYQFNVRIIVIITCFTNIRNISFIIINIFPIFNKSSVDILEMDEDSYFLELHVRICHSKYQKKYHSR